MASNSAVPAVEPLTPQVARSGWSPLGLTRRPFFEDKNRAFWILQSVGWAGYFVLRTLSGFANSMGWSFVVHTALLTAAGYSITLLMAAAYRRLIRMKPVFTWVGSIVIVVFSAAAFSAIETPEAKAEASDAVAMAGIHMEEVFGAKRPKPGQYLWRKGSF